MARTRTIIALDPGATKTCALVVSIAHGSPHILGAARATSVGLRKGGIADLGAAASSLAHAAQEACRVAGVRCERAIVAVSGEHLRWSSAAADVPLAGRAVGERDIDSGMRRAVESAHIAEGDEVLHALPAAFAVDQQSGIADPVGMTGRRLRVDAALIIAASTALDHLERCVESAGLLLEQEVAAGLAAACGVTAPAEREAGVLVIDIGASTSDFVAYRDGVVATAGALGWGGRSVTRDIALGLRITTAEAERLKREQAAALARLVPAAEITLASGERAGRWFLAEIVEARLREILELVGERVRAADVSPTLAVLTGGETRLPGMAQLAEAVLECPVRIGHSDAAGEAGVARDPAWAVARGLAHYAAAHRASPARPRGRLARARGWIRDSFK